MTRTPITRSYTHPYHVTCRNNNREAFHCPMPRAWEILTEHALEISIIYEAQIHALVLMPNHFHLLLTSPRYELKDSMKWFVQSVTRSLNRVSGRSGRVFGRRYYGSLVDSPIYFANVLKYVYRNPVTANLCESVEDYPYSTIHGVLGTGPAPLPLHYPFGRSDFLRVPNQTSELQAWLNRPFRREHYEAIRNGLRKANFAPTKQGWKRQLEELKTDLL